MKPLVGRRFLGMAMTAVAIACGTADVDQRDEQLGELHARLSDLERVLGFEQLSDWTASSGVLSASSQHTEGAASLGIANVGYSQLTSIAAGPLGPVGSSGSLDILVPGTGSLAWGTVQPFVDIPAQNVWNAPLPSMSLQGLPLGEFQHLTFPIDATLQAQLGSASSLVFRLAINVPESGTSQPVLLDHLNFVQSTGQGGGGGAGGTGGSGGTGGTGGDSGSGGSGTGNTGGVGGAAGSGGSSGGGTSGTGGSAGSGGAPSGAVVPFFIRLPRGVSRQQIALGSSGQQLMVDDRVLVIQDANPGAFASVSSVDASATSRLGVEAHVQSWWAHSSLELTPTLELANRAHVHGSALSSGTITQAPDTIVDGSVDPNSELGPIATISWDVAFLPGAPVMLEPGQTLALAPGSYGGLTVKTGAHLQIAKGRFSFDGPILVEAGGSIDIDNAAGAVYVYGRALTFRGTQTKTAPAANVMFGVAGADPVVVENSFDGLLVAPYATVSFGSSTLGYRGSTFSRGVVVHQNTTYRHVPWNPLDFCAGKQCGDDPSDGFNGVCPNLCGNGQPGCTSDVECSPGSVCAYGMGPRFNFPEGTNVCWPIECTRQDPSEPTCGVDPAVCGTCPACEPSCEAGSTGPDGCGGFCGTCGADQVRLPNGECGALRVLSDALENFPIPFPPMATDPEGAIPGSFQVTDRGTAAYTIAVQVPPGRMGIQPALTLNYTSTKNNGMLGMSWSLGGLSAITRCPSIVDREGVTGAVDFSENDRFCLDGHALVQVPNGVLYGGNGAEYRTEIDTFVRVRSRHALGSDPSTGPSHFDVQTKDGRIMTYGSAAPNDTSSVFAGAVKRIWGLRSIQDRSTNSLRIDYRARRAVGRHELGSSTEFDSGELLPDTISYGGTLGTSHSRFVKFVYEDRPDPRWHYVSGATAFSLSRLTAIETYVGDQLVKRYKIVYWQVPPDESRILQIWECAVDGGTEKCLEPTSFGYHGERTPVALPHPGGVSEFGKFIGGSLALDMDGDGRDEVLSFHGFHVVRPQPWLLTNMSEGSAVYIQLPEPSTGISTCVGSGSVIDLNRDGRDDIVDLCGFQQSDPHVMVHLSEGTSFSSQRIELPPQGLGSSEALRLLIDLDGDGLRDLIGCSGRRIVGIYQNLGTTFGTPHPVPGRTPFDFIDLPVPGDCQDLFALDVDSDGQEELILPNGDSRIRVLDPETVIEQDGDRWQDWGPSSINPDGDYWLVDANGDGLADIVTLAGGGQAPDGSPAVGVRIQLNTGKAFTSGSFQPYLIGGTLPEEFHAAALDYDGDGRQELVTSLGVIYFPLNNGRVATFDRVDGGISISTIADVNGDGSGDIFPALALDEARSVLLTNYARTGLLRNVVDGNGKQIDIHYQAGQELADLGEPPLDERTYFGADCASDNTTFQNTCLRRVAPLVSAHEESQINRISHPDTTTTTISPGRAFKYRYSHARAGLGGRGWFGFQSRSVELDTFSRTTLFYENTSFLFAGRLSVSLRGYVQDAPANRLTNATSRLELSTFIWERFSGDHVDFPMVASEVHQVREGTPPSVLTSIETERTPNTYGTIVSETTRTFTAGEEIASVTTTRMIDDDPSIWLLGRVTDVVTEARRGSATPVLRRQHFEYEPGTQLLVSIEREPDPATPGQPNPSRPTEYLKTVLDRRPDGNIFRACSSDARGAPFQRCAEVLEFDEDGIFPRIVRDEEQLETKTVYSMRDGQLLSVTDPNGLVSQVALDAFGRPQQVRTPTSEGFITYSSETMPATPTGPAITTRAAFGVTETFRGQQPSKRIFDAFGRVVRESGPAFQGGSTSVVQNEFEYDPLGRLVRATLPHLNADTSQGIAEYTYDAFGRKSSEAYPGNATVRFYYPTRNNVQAAFAELFAPLDLPSSGADIPATAVVVEKPRQNLDITVADSHGNPVRTVQASVTNDERTVSEYSYVNYDVLQRVSSEGGQTLIISDEIGRPVEVLDPALGAQRYTYTGFDEVATHTDANLVTTEFSYDAKGRSLQIRDVTRNEVVARWIYGQLDAPENANERGRLIGAYRQSKPGSSTGSWMRYRYQPRAGGINRGLPETVEYSIGGTSDSLGSGPDRFMVGFEYQPEASSGSPNSVPWRLHVLHYPDQGGSFGVVYGYDPDSGAAQLVHAAHIPNASPYWQLLETDQGFRPKRETFGNGLTTSRDYYSIPTAAEDCVSGSDTSCLPGTLRGIVTHHFDTERPLVQNVEYRYNRNGQVRVARFPHAQDTSREYRYDGFDRLVYDRHPDSELQLPSYFYDSAGNFTSKAGVGSYTYDLPGKPFQVHHAGSTEHFYDDAGNITERRGTTVPGTVQTFRYNQFSLPYGVTSGEDTAASLTEFEYDGSGARLIKRRRGGPADDSPLIAVTTTIAELYEQVTEHASGTPTTTHEYRIYAGGRQVAQVQRAPALPEQVRYLHDDQLGSATVVTDTTGHPLETRHFTSFGEPESIDFTQTGVTSGFTGHQHDPELGLINMRGRIYDPKIGRFLTADPLINGIDAAGLNRYSYVRNDPLNLTDPSGFSCYPTCQPEGPPPTPDQQGGGGQTEGPPPPDVSDTGVPPPGSSGPPGGGTQSAPTSDGPQGWMPEPSAQHYVDAKRQAESAASLSQQPIGGQETASTTIQQPTNMPRQAESDSWSGGDSGGMSSLGGQFVPDLTPQRAPDLNGAGGGLGCSECWVNRRDLTPEQRAAMDTGTAVSAGFILGGGVVGRVLTWLGVAAPVFGANDLVIGLSSGGALQEFVRRHGGRTFGQFASSARTFAGQIRDAMNQASRIRVNLDGIDLRRINGALNQYGEPAAGYTNYELWLIRNTPEFSSKTSFYRNGAEVRSPF